MTAIPHQDEWVLKQHHNDIGDLTLYVTHDAVKYAGNNSEFFCLAKAPTWEVICYRPKEKVFWSGPLRLLNCNMLFNPMYKAKPTAERMFREQAFRESHIQAVGKGVWSGISFTEYSASDPHRIFRTTKDMDVDWHGTDFMNRLTGTPRLDEVPLYMRKNKDDVQKTYTSVHSKTKSLPFGLNTVGNDLRLGPVVTLISTSCKKIKYNDKDFEVPKGLTRVNDIFGVTFSKSLKEDITDAIDSVGFTSDHNEKKLQSGPKSKVTETSRIGKP